jgi:hypothetical protein
MTDDELKYFEKNPKGGYFPKTLNLIISGSGGKSVITETLYNQQSNLKCWCNNCCKEATGYHHLFHMVLCPECKNKRCPKASNHVLECSGSNAPGQDGSLY